MALHQNHSKTILQMIKTISFFFLLLLSTNLFSQIEWANKVIGFSSEMKTNTPGQYLAKEALGKPSIMPPQVSSPCAWSPSTTNNPRGEWIQLGFKPIKAQQVAVLESFNTGAIAMIWLYDAENNEYLVYENMNPKFISQGARMANFFFPPTTYEVVAVKIGLMTAAVLGENQIDAVALSSSLDSVKVVINTSLDFVTTDIPENLGAMVNSSTEELGPIISPDGKQLYFIRQGHFGNVGRPETQDTWVSTLDSNNVPSLAANIGEPINNSDNNGLISITPDGQKALLLNAYLPNGKMEKGVSMTEKVNGSWGTPKALVIEDYYNDNVYGEYFLNGNGNVLLMTVQRKDGIGSKDLFVSFLEGEKWTKPLNMGNVVNSAHSETSPFLAADGVTLYFSSRGFPGYGGTDMFVSKRLDDTWTNWSEPMNMGPTINSPNFDAYYSIPASGQYAYYVSYANSLGGADIFRAKLPKALRPQPVVLVKGRVLDAETNLPLGAQISYEDLNKDKILGRAQSDGKSGEYSIVLPAGTSYGFLGITDGYFAVSENVDLSKLEEYQEITRDIKLVPIKKGQLIRLNNVFFDSGKFNLRKESTSELARLVKLLKENPNMKIEIQGHTDDVGKDESNLSLSKNRAQAVFEHLTKNGVALERLLSKGYGEGIPLVPNTNAENRQQNRRVQFLILEL